MEGPGGLGSGTSSPPIPFRDDTYSVGKTEFPLPKTSCMFYHKFRIYSLYLLPVYLFVVNDVGS
jgi:hypothetical protein